jgi:hypothetical protein
VCLWLAEACLVDGLVKMVALDDAICCKLYVYTTPAVVQLRLSCTADCALPGVSRMAPYTTGCSQTHTSASI